MLRRERISQAAMRDAQELRMASPHFEPWANDRVRRNPANAATTYAV